MAGTSLQTSINIDYTQVANLNPQARQEFDKLKESLKGLSITSKEYYDINVKMADILNGTVQPLTSVNDAATKLKTGLDGVSNSAKLATDSTGELKNGLTSVNSAFNVNLDSMGKQKIAFLDLGRIITGQGFSLRSVASNFALLGPVVQLQLQLWQV
jgi:uncharacterized phage infection (PIP) family protein YhgE